MCWRSPVFRVFIVATFYRFSDASDAAGDLLRKSGSIIGQYLIRETSISIEDSKMNVPEADGLVSQLQVNRGYCYSSKISQA